MNRRDFLRSGLAVAALGWAGRPTAEGQQHAGRIMTVQGPIPAEELGSTLIHEHVLVDFVGADEVSSDRYDAEEVFRVMLPYLERVRAAGCQALVECTPAYLGRDPSLLRRLAGASGVRLVTNTGYYGAVKDKFLPPHAFTETADELAERWLAEWREGIDGTGIRPGFIKTAVDPAPLSDVDRKLLRAAARTHLQSGLTIASHTSGGGPAALAQLEILHEEGVDPGAWIWVHAQIERDGQLHVQAARRGAWISFDGIQSATIDRHVDLVSTMKQHDLLDRVLISQDAGWYSVGEPQGGSIRPFDTLFTEFLSALKQADFSAADIERLLVVNPREALTVRVRRQAG
jgi:predicted metal-dependent phosphotriesterase family hydrolase